MHWPIHCCARAYAVRVASPVCACLVVIATALGPVSPAAAQELPDLTVTDVTVRADCMVVATVKNLGPGPLPAIPRDTQGVQYLKGGGGFGGWSLSPAEIEILRPAGGTLTTSIGPMLDGEGDISAVVDNGHVLKEADETNNTFTKRLSCSMSLPDIAITGIRFSPAPSCAPTLTLANRGNGPVPDKAWDEGRFGRLFDGAHLDDTYGPRLVDVDPKRSLQPAGGTVEWSDPTSFRALKTIRYELSNLNFRQKYSLADDAIETTVPAACLPDLVIDSMTTNANCDVLVLLRNAGPGPLPSKAVGADGHPEVPAPSLQFLVPTGGVLRGSGWILSQSEAMPLRLPGGTTTSTLKNPAPLDLGTPTPVVGVAKVTLYTNGLTEARTDNNTLEQTLNCGAPPPVNQAPPPVNRAPRPNEPAEVMRRPTPMRGARPAPPAAPPLAIRSVQWTAACRAVLTVANASGAALPEAFYRKDGVLLERSLVGTAAVTTPLTAIDPSGVLKRAGATLDWTDPTVFMSSGTVRWRIAGLGGDPARAPVATGSVPARCGKRILPKR